MKNRLISVILILSLLAGTALASNFNGNSSTTINGVTIAPSAKIDTTNASNITSGTISPSIGGTGATSIGTGLSNAGGVLVATGASAPLYIPNLNIASNQQLPHWRGALARVMAKAGDAHVLVIGDSTAANESKAIPQMLESAGMPVMVGALSGAGDVTCANATQNKRLTIGSWTCTASNTNAADSIGGNVLQASATTTTPMSFTPYDPVDTFYIRYEAVSGGGSFSYSVDGGSATTVSTTSSTSGLTTVTIAAGSLGIHTLALNWVSGTVSIQGLDMTDSTRNYVHYYNAGWGGSISNNWNSTTNGWSPNNSAAIASYAPDLTIIMLCVNDWIQSYGASTCQTNEAALIAAYQQSNAGDVIIMTPPLGTSVSQATQQTYVNAMIAAAAAATANSGTGTGIPVVDNWSTFIPYATSYAAGLLATDGIHQSSAGALDIARNLLPLLIPGKSSGTNITSHGISSEDDNSGVKSLQGIAGVRGPWGVALSMNPMTYTDITDVTATISIPQYISAFSQPTIASGNNAYNTFTTAATVGIAGPPIAGNSTTITNPYSLYVASGNSYFGGQSITIGTLTTPSHTATCTAGTMWVDANYIYVCSASGTVKRAALSTF